MKWEGEGVLSQRTQPRSAIPLRDDEGAKTIWWLQLCMSPPHFTACTSVPTTRHLHMSPTRPYIVRSSISVNKLQHEPTHTPFVTMPIPGLCSFPVCRLWSNLRDAAWNRSLLTFGCPSAADTAFLLRSSLWH